MKSLPSTVLSLLVTALAWCATTQSFAAANDGVRCPNGYETHFDASSKTMRCERTTPVLRPTVCDPTAPEHVVYRNTKGRDFCVKAADAALPASTFSETDPRRRPAVCIGDAAEGLKWLLEPDAISGDRDRCRAVRVEWIYPSQQ